MDIPSELLVATHLALPLALVVVSRASFVAKVGAWRAKQARGGGAGRRGRFEPAEFRQ